MENDIRVVARKNLDIEKYQLCINTDENISIYANCWYMDAVCNSSWKAIVLADYKAVLPFYTTRLRKSNFKLRVVQPAYSQQLGTFSVQTLTEHEKKAMFDKLQKQKVFNYCFHSNSIFQKNQEIIEKRNYILNLSTSYDNLWNSLKSTKRNRIRKAENNGTVQVFDNMSDELIDFVCEYNPVQFNRAKSNLFKRLLKSAAQNTSLAIYTYSVGSELATVAVYLNYRDRIYYINSASNSLGKEYSGINAIFNSIIKNNANSNKTLDFEGSELKGVERFIKGFNAELEPYYCFTPNQ